MSAATAAPTPTPTNTPVHESCLDRVAKLPMVEIALMKSVGLYERVKSSHEFVNWTLSTAEATAKMAYDAATPVINKLPMEAVDEKLCKGLDYVEAKFPCVKGQPEQVYEDAKMYSLDKMAAAKTFGTDKVHSLTDLSWQKANEVLATRYGNMAFNGFGASANVAEQYFDYYFPPRADEDTQSDPPATNAQLEDRVMVTVHTVGRLSSKMARRVYHTVSDQVRSLNSDNAHEYVRSLVALLTLNNYIDAMHAAKNGEKKEETKPTEETKPKEDKS